MVVVTKFDGTRQEFQREKVVKTCLRLHATRGVAERIADKIEGEVYEGIPTRKILEMVYGYLRKYKPAIEHLVDLREAIGRLRSKPDFEFCWVRRAIG
ncbi:MAG: ATP cone domain-containing protein [Candidatus Bathyarchaeia archaeon]